MVETPPLWQGYDQWSLFLNSNSESTSSKVVVHGNKYSLCQFLVPLVSALSYVSRLTSLKVLNSIILLGMSCQHVKDKEAKDNVKRHENEDLFTGTTISSPTQQQFVSDPLDRDPNKQLKSSVTRKVKALNEIDRYTLCSSRIV